MNLHTTNNENEVNLEWISGDHRFLIWMDDFEAGWAFVSKAEDMFGGTINKEVLTALYDQIGKILGKS